MLDLTPFKYLWYNARTIEERNLIRSFVRYKRRIPVAKRNAYYQDYYHMICNWFEHRILPGRLLLEQHMERLLDYTRSKFDRAEVTRVDEQTFDLRWYYKELIITDQNNESYTIYDIVAGIRYQAHRNTFNVIQRSIEKYSWTRSEANLGFIVPHAERTKQSVTCTSFCWGSDAPSTKMYIQKDDIPAPISVEMLFTEMTIHVEMFDRLLRTQYVNRDTSHRPYIQFQQLSSSVKQVETVSNSDLEAVLELINPAQLNITPMPGVFPTCQVRVPAHIRNEITNTQTTFFRIEDKFFSLNNDYSNVSLPKGSTVIDGLELVSRWRDDVTPQGTIVKCVPPNIWVEVETILSNLMTKTAYEKFVELENQNPSNVESADRLSAQDDSVEGVVGGPVSQEELMYL